MADTVLFYAIAAGTLFGAFRVVTVSNLFHGAIWLIAVLFGVAGLYLLIGAQFLSAVQVTVYVGGIVVLIVFAILLVTDVNEKTRPESSLARRAAVAAAAVGLGALIIYATGAFGFGRGTGAPAQTASIQEIGKAMLSMEKGGLILPFETISLLLIATLVGALTVARPEPAAAQPVKGQK